MRFQLRARSSIQFVASIQHGKRLNLLAANAFVITRAGLRRGLRLVLRNVLGLFALIIFLPVHHSNPSNLARSFRVARKSEFFTVSSVVPSASPISFSFRP